MESKEIEKYIFDPNSPNKCKAYKLLVKIAKQKPLVYFSSNILKHLLGKKIFSDKIKEELWDIPENYDELSLEDKFHLFKKQYSKKELKEFIEKIINENKLFEKTITKYKFFDKILILVLKHIYSINILDYNIVSKIESKNNILDNILIEENSFNYNEINSVSKINHAIFITDKTLDFLKFNIIKSSIVIMPLENAQEFFEKNKNSNIKPIFLKKLDDLELLLNILENDLIKKSEINDNEISFISNVKVKNFYSIKDIEVNLKGKKEIYIVGENGDGKTLFLQSIAIGLVGIEEGEVFDLVKNQEYFKIEIQDTQGIIYNTSNEKYKYLLAYGASRYSFCQIKEDESGYLSLFSSSYDLTNPIEFLKYIDYKTKSEEKSNISLNDIKRLLTDILNQDIEIIVTPDSVKFIERGSNVTFEQLSSGYKGIITIVCDIINKLSKKEPNIKKISELSGIVLIDEVDLHLHPKWKYRFIKKLREIFPNIQFIVTTHSISIISGASKDALFLRVKKENGEIKISDIKNAHIDYINDIQNSIFNFDSNLEKIYSKKKQSEVKKALLNLIDDIEDKK